MSVDLSPPVEGLMAPSVELRDQPVKLSTHLLGLVAELSYPSRRPIGMP